MCLCLCLPVSVCLSLSPLRSVDSEYTCIMYSYRKLPPSFPRGLFASKAHTLVDWELVCRIGCVLHHAMHNECLDSSHARCRYRRERTGDQVFMCFFLLSHSVQLQHDGDHDVFSACWVILLFLSVRRTLTWTTGSLSACVPFFFFLPFFFFSLLFFVCACVAASEWILYLHRIWLRRNIMAGAKPSM